MSSMRALMGAGVKSVQQGSINVGPSVGSATATVSAVNTAKAVLSKLGASSAANDINQVSVALALTNSTTITATRGAFGIGVVVNYCLVEYY